jgi:hypothetical protein
MLAVGKQSLDIAYPVIIIRNLKQNAKILHFLLQLGCRLLDTLPPDFLQGFLRE